MQWSKIIQREKLIAISTLVSKLIEKSMNYKWHLYILQCADDTLYTGITNDLANRLTTHNAGKGAKYTRSRLPVVLVYSEPHPDKSSALRREIAVKKMGRAQKLALIRSL